MRSEDKGTRALAAELLAGTENGRLLVRDLRRVRSGLNLHLAKGQLLLPIFGRPVALVRILESHH